MSFVFLFLLIAGISILAVSLFGLLLFMYAMNHFIDLGMTGYNDEKYIGKDK